MSQAQWTLLISVLALCISLISAIAGLGSWLEAYRQIKVQNLLHLSQYLHQAEYRDARQKVRTGKRGALEADAVRKVCSSFDFAGLFVHHHLVDPQIFISYWGDFLFFLQDHLSENLDQPLFGDVTIRKYYKHFHLLLEETAKQQKGTPSHKKIVTAAKQ